MKSNSLQEKHNVFGEAMALITLLCAFAGSALATDAAYFTGGDLKVDGIHFKEDGNVIRKLSDLSSPWTILDPNIYYLGGNVGIGTMSPGAKLTVSSSGMLADFISSGPWNALRLFEGSTPRTYLGYGDNGTILSGALADSTALYAVTGGLHLTASVYAHDGITVTPSGNVGIGTTGPLYRFQVVDSLAGNNAAAIYGEHAITDGVATGILGKGGSIGVKGIAEGMSDKIYYGLFANASKALNVSIGTTIGAQFQAYDGLSTYGLSSFAISSNSATGTAYGGYFSASGGANNYGIFVDGAKNYFQGSVGIGTSGPSYKLHVVDATVSDDSAAIYGEHAVTDFYGIGVEGKGGWIGVRGSSSGSGSSSYFGVRGSASSTNGTAGTTYGGYFAASGAANNYGIYVSGQQSYFSGNVGIGVLTPNAKLQVFGDIRVGTSGSNGCIQNYAGAQILGSCSSDERLKRDIRPFDPVLEKVAQLKPVHYFWRADEFPERHYGNTENSGLIAQDVEKVFPEMVSTDEQGFKQVNYSELQYLMLGAVRELKAQNDKLTLDNEALKSRVERLEKMLNIEQE